MGKVIIAMSMSLDGYVAGPNINVEFPMGEGGLRLHEWLFNSAANKQDEELIRELLATTGAVVLGKRTFDVGLAEWGDTPYPAPSFVVTHRAQPKRIEKSGTFTFVTEGVESAVQRAKIAGGNRNVTLMGASICEQSLEAGLVDEILINLVPVVLAEGSRLFSGAGHRRVELEQVQVIESPQVTHLRYRVIK